MNLFEEIKTLKEQKNVLLLAHYYQNNDIQDIVDYIGDSLGLAQQAQKTKVVKFCNNNLIDWVLKNDVSGYNNIWCSNILSYKWTMLHTTVDKYNSFQLKIQ